MLWHLLAQIVSHLYVATIETPIHWSTASVQGWFQNCCRTIRLEEVQMYVREERKVLHMHMQKKYYTVYLHQ